jgi:hydroxypyruvate reductase 2
MASAIAVATVPPSGAKHSVLLLRRANDRLAAALRARYLVVNFYASGASLPAFLAASAAAEPEPPRAALVVGDGTIRVNAAFLDAAPYLRCVVTTAAGLDHIDVAECARRGVLVAGAGQTFSTDVADHAVGLLIDVLRRVSAADRYVRRGMWPVQGDYPLGSEVCQFISLLKTVTDTYKFTIFPRKKKKFTIFPILVQIARIKFVIRSKSQEIYQLFD